jgi:hypothetical protein
VHLKEACAPCSPSSRQSTSRRLIVTRLPLFESNRPARARARERIDRVSIHDGHHPCDWKWHSNPRTRLAGHCALPSYRVAPGYYLARDTHTRSQTDAQEAEDGGGAEDGRAGSRSLGATCIAAMANGFSTVNTMTQCCNTCGTLQRRRLPLIAGSQTREPRSAAQRSARLAAQLRMGSPCT